MDLEDLKYTGACNHFFLSFFLISGCSLGIELTVHCKYGDQNPKLFLGPLAACFTHHTKDNTRGLKTPACTC